MKTGKQLYTFITGLNADADIDITLLTVLVETAKTILEAERPWMVLRRTDTSLTLTTANLYTTPVSLDGITDFAELYGDYPVRLHDGDNRIEYFTQVPFDRQLEYKDSSNTFCFDENTNTLYFNGVIPFNGTLNINYKAVTADIDLESESAIWSPFPSRFLPLLGFYAVGINKGAVDYDTINRDMLPSNERVLVALKTAMEEWDNQRQLSTMAHNDPTEMYSGHRNGAINLN